MRKASLILLLFALISCNTAKKKTSSKEESQKERYQETWESLSNYHIPEWMKEAKFGIFIHWGPNSVAQRHTDWYPRWMYMDKGNMNPQTGAITTGKPHKAYLYHKEQFGDQKHYGFKDLIPQWTMEKFNPQEWVSLFKEAGAQYVVPVAEHHDGYALYASSHTPYNAVDMGPNYDVFESLAKEIKKQGLIFGASSHLAFNWNFYNQQPYFDTGDPQYEALYAPQHKPSEPASEEWLAKVWWPRTKEIIDKYQPDILWFDFFLDRPEFAPYHKKLAAYYYNTGLDRNTDVVLQTKNYKYESYKPGTHMLDLERSKSDVIRKEYWQTDTSIGKNSWFYSKDWISKSTDELVADLIDIVSKNGCLLLNIGPDKDGTIPEEQQVILREIGAWLKVNSEAIYGANAWKVFGEGPTKTATGHLSESKNKKYTAKDIRFTMKDNQLYASVLAPNGNTITINTLSSKELKVNEISLLGYNGEIAFTQSEESLKIKLPNQNNLKNALVFKVN